MTSKQKFTAAIMAVLIVVIAFGAHSVLAQDKATPTPNPVGPSTQGWNMYGMMWGNQQGDPMWTAVSTALGIDVNTLFTELQSGKTLAQIAKAHDVDVQKAYDAALAVMTDYMNTTVKSGYITQTQADTQLSWMHDNIAQMPMFNGTSYGSGMMGGMMGGYNQGMMGQGDRGWGQDNNGWTGTMHGWCH